MVVESNTLLHCTSSNQLHLISILSQCVMDYCKSCTLIITMFYKRHSYSSTKVGPAALQTFINPQNVGANLTFDTF